MPLLSKIAAVNLPDSGAICNPSPRFDGNLYRFIGAKRVSAAQYFVALAFLSSPPASPYGKGRCHEGTEGIRNSGIGKGNQAKNALLCEKIFDNLRTGFRL